MRIYTKSGDDGTTGLLYGGRTRKDSARIAANGAIDEAQAAIGVARAHGRRGELDAILTGLERDLYVLMAEVATAPQNRHKLSAGSSLVTEEMVTALEALIDDVSDRFDMPTEFVIPGGSPTAASLDVARTVVRRAERQVLVIDEVVDPRSSDPSWVVPYLNRLSDLLWALARWQEGDVVPSRSAAAPPTPS